MFWIDIVTYILTAIGLLAIIAGIAIAVQFCRGAGLIERRPWEGD